MSSRLFQKIREDRGLCYSIYAQSAAYEDTGHVTIYAGTSEDEIGELTAADHGRAEARGRRHDRGRGGPRPGAAAGGAADGAGKPVVPGRTQCAAAVDLGPRFRRSVEAVAKIDAVDTAVGARLCERADRGAVGAGDLRAGRHGAGDRGDPARAWPPDAWPEAPCPGRDRADDAAPAGTWRLAAMVRIARNLGRVPGEMGAGLGQRPPDPAVLHQPGLLGAAGRGAGHGAADAADPARGPAASGRADAGQHPPRPVADRDARLLDRRSPLPGRATCARRSWR